VTSSDASDKMLKSATKTRWERRKEPAFDRYRKPLFMEESWMKRRGRSSKSGLVFDFKSAVEGVHATLSLRLPFKDLLYRLLPVISNFTKDQWGSI
jgi:hypothetical protein